SAATATAFRIMYTRLASLLVCAQWVAYRTYRKANAENPIAATSTASVHQGKVHPIMRGMTMKCMNVPNVHRPAPTAVNAPNGVTSSSIGASGMEPVVVRPTAPGTGVRTRGASFLSSAMPILSFGAALQLLEIDQDRLVRAEQLRQNLFARPSGTIDRTAIFQIRPERLADGRRQ